MKKTVLFISALMLIFISHARSQAKSDSVGIFDSIMEKSDTHVVIAGFYLAHQNSATAYFLLEEDKRTFGMQSFSGMKDTIPFQFRILGLRPQTVYTLKLIAFKNDDTKQICGQGKITFTTDFPPPPESLSDKKKRKR